MTSWGTFAEDHRELAATIRACFAVRKHATMATLRLDGSPRISGTEVEWSEDGIHLGMMPGSLKALDLRRDPRLAVHSPTRDAPEDDPFSWLGEAKLAGHAVEVTDPDSVDGAHRFRVELSEVVHTTVAETGDHLLITSWDPAHGLRQRERR